MKRSARNRIGMLFSGLLATTTAFSQAGADSLQQAFVRYQLNAFQEKVFVHTNKTFYLAGEIAWFKVWLVDGYLHRPSSASRVVCVEVIAKDQRPVLQARIAIDSGSGNGSFLIPSSLPSGHYRLRAYTNWMKNFSPGFYYEQTLTIVNTLKEPEAPAPSAPPSYSIQFFPEGGNLVAGLLCKTGFKITDRYDRSVPASGAVLDDQKDTVARFKTGHAGMGSFLFTPQPGREYRAVLHIGDTTVGQPLPTVYNQGYVMQLTEAGDNKIQVSVTGTGVPLTSVLYLLVHTRHLLKSIQSAGPAMGKWVFLVDKNSLGDGISHFTIFNAARQPVCERLYFKRPVTKLVIDAHTGQPVYAGRKKVNIEISTGDNTGHALPADVSVSVFMTDSLQSPRYTDIGAYLLLSSDIKGTIEDPAYYFDSTDAGSDAAADNLMLTQGWRRFRWEDVLTGHPFFEWLPEKEGTIIQAKVTDRRSGQPAVNIPAWLSVPGQTAALGTATSRAGGSLRFNTGNFYGRNEIIAQPGPAADSAYRVDIIGAYSDKFSANPFPYFALSPQWKDQLEYRSINTQVENSYGQRNKERYILPGLADTNAFYGPPDKQYYLDDYTRFTTMDEVMREYVAEVKVRQQSGKYNFRVLNIYFKAFFDNDPLVLLDGVPVFDLNRIMSLDPLKIKKIEIMYRRYYLGGLSADGILQYKTYEGDLAGYTLDPNAVVVEYDGLQREREFYTPVYETDAQTSSRLPDFRNALHWAPRVKTGSDGKQQLSFYTGDLKGRFAVVIQGLTPEGLAGSTLCTFEVR